MLHQPVDRLFARPRRVLLAGIGGGFDVVCGLPLALRLMEAGHHVVLANLTFTNHRAVTGGEALGDSLLRVDARSGCDNGYFPEGHLARWFLARRGLEVPVHLFTDPSLPALQAGYRRLVETEAIDTLLQVDGGIDGLLSGREYSLGTPTWDALSLAAVHRLEVEAKLVAFVGLGAERYDRIAHSEALEGLAELAGRSALLGSEALLANSPEGAAFLEALEFVHRAQGPAKQSIVASTIRAALEGRFGDTVVNDRTRDTPIWVSPLAQLVWYVDHDALVARKPYMAAMLATRTVAEAASLIEGFHREHGRREFMAIPI